jgi:hypothetical protein
MSLSNGEIFRGCWHQSDFTGLTVGRVSDDMSHAFSNLEGVEESSVVHHPSIRPAQASLDEAPASAPLLRPVHLSYLHYASTSRIRTPSCSCSFPALFQFSENDQADLYLIKSSLSSNPLIHESESFTFI